MLQGGKAKKAKKKGKKEKKEKKGKKGKTDKDMTQDRTPESLFEELSMAGIAKRVAPVGMADYCGQYR